MEPYNGYGFKIYKYDESGQKEIVIYKSLPNYNSKEEAIDAGVEYCEKNNIQDYEIIFEVY